MQQSAVHHLGMLVQYPLSTRQIPLKVLKNKAEAKRDQRRPLEIQKTKSVELLLERGHKMQFHVGEELIKMDRCCIKC